MQLNSLQQALRANQNQNTSNWAKNKTFTNIQSEGELGRSLIERLISSPVSATKIDERVGSPLVHVSSVIKMLEKKYCPLRHKYDIEHLRSGKSPLHHMFSRTDLSTLYVFSIGRAYETLTREALIHSVSPATIFGEYSCECGEISYKGENVCESNLTKCSKCSTIATKYKEVVLRVGALVGSPDFITRLGMDSNYTVVEFKSINDNDFEKLSFVKNDYKLQVMTYLGMLRYMSVNPTYSQLHGVDLEKFNLEAATLMYTTKKHKTNPSGLFKSYDIVWEDQLPQMKKAVMQIIQMFAKIRDITEYEGSGIGHEMDSKGRIKSFDSKSTDLCVACPYIDNCKTLIHTNYKENQDGVL